MQQTAQCSRAKPSACESGLLLSQLTLIVKVLLSQLTLIVKRLFVGSVGRSFTLVRIYEVSEGIPARGPGGAFRIIACCLIWRWTTGRVSGGRTSGPAFSGHPHTHRLYRTQTLITPKTHCLYDSCPLMHLDTCTLIHLYTHMLTCSYAHALIH